MKTRYIAISSVVVVAALGLTLAPMLMGREPSAPANTFRARSGQVTPDWQAGDSWQVACTVNSYREPMDESAGPGSQEDVVYTYTVLPDLADPGFPGVPVTKIGVDSDGWGDWVLVFSDESLSLLAVDDMDGAGVVRYENPYGRSSWMPNLRQFHLAVVHDFPQLRRLVSAHESGAPSSHRVKPLLEGEPGFVEKMDPTGNGRVHVAFERTDPETSFLHTTELVWTVGDDWWSRAVVKLGGQVELTARLLP